MVAMAVLCTSCKKPTGMSGSGDAQQPVLKGDHPIVNGRVKTGHEWAR
jgi:hypothetical protein